MILYRVYDDFTEVKKGGKVAVPDSATLVGWKDEGGDPVFVAVQAKRHADYNLPFPNLVEPVARQVMKKKLGEDPGEPNYIFKGHL